MTATTPRVFVLSVLVLLMAASRAHVFDHFSPPDATWAAFFIAGFHLRGWGRWVFPLLTALAVAVDWYVISGQGIDFWNHYCVSPGYWALVPAYGAMWAGGAWMRRRYAGANWEALGRLAAALVASVAVCHLIAQGGFYWTSPVVAEPTLAGWWKNYTDWLPPYMATAGTYVAIAAALQAAAERIGPLLRDRRDRGAH
ncbi:hypothetical protein B1992_08205 [Pseudoxanthomonas broegbernensis]|uniref:Uncharacterized protein n=1 Tax=Pseudoxanthomonas broegbernensis TaxID=83619 RepID=A0A7V8GMH6_9GAMM|nr:hypothetical protein [Pseudoxanthomonas broegbernensis]KAF1686519.1 hypothetical protein B1992_08205 [Pseudoxanthomonas broegbernensis]MBB6064219.1 hypothetical protein [Pseudoxanthomonas broegbernensis]